MLEKLRFRSQTLTYAWNSSVRDESSFTPVCPQATVKSLWQAMDLSEERSSSSRLLSMVAASRSIIIPSQTSPSTGMTAVRPATLTLHSGSNTSLFVGRAGSRQPICVCVSVFASKALNRCRVHVTPLNRLLVSAGLAMSFAFVSDLSTMLRVLIHQL